MISRQRNSHQLLNADRVMIFASRSGSQRAALAAETHALIAAIRDSASSGRSVRPSAIARRISRSRLSCRTASSLWRSSQMQLRSQKVTPLAFGERMRGKRSSNSDARAKKRAPHGSRPDAPNGNVNILSSDTTGRRVTNRKRDTSQNASRPSDVSKIDDPALPAQRSATDQSLSGSPPFTCTNSAIRRELLACRTTTMSSWVSKCTHRISGSTSMSIRRLIAISS